MTNGNEILFLLLCAIVAVKEGPSTSTTLFLLTGANEQFTESQRLTALFLNLTMSHSSLIP